MDVGFIIFSSMWAALSAILVRLWQEFSETHIPPLKWIPIDQGEPKLKQSQRSVRQRGWYLFSTASLGFFVGSLIALYIKGLMTDHPPNDYAVLFYELLGGFLMPNILDFLNKIKIEKNLSKLQAL